MSKTNCIDNFHGDYHWLSNFEPCDVVFDGKIYPSVEHAYQAAKTFDLEHREKIRTAPRAASAKKYGQEAELREDWERIKLTVMYDLLQQKFSHNRFIFPLIKTGSQELVEGNWWGDTYWGVCNGVGNNHLGQLLMLIRDQINEEFE